MKNPISTLLPPPPGVPHPAASGPTPDRTALPLPRSRSEPRSLDRVGLQDLPDRRRRPVRTAVGDFGGEDT